MWVIVITYMFGDVKGDGWIDGADIGDALEVEDLVERDLEGVSFGD